MRLVRLFGGVAVSLCSLTALLAAEPSPTGWMTGFEAAQAQAQVTGKPLLVHFYADWCGPCQIMEGTVLNTPDVLRRLGTDVIGVKVNSDQRADLISRYGVSGLPCDVFLSPEGRDLTRSSGAMNPQGYAAQIAGIGRSYAAPPQTQLAETKPAPATGADAPVGAPRSVPLGLAGYSPVALTAHRQWVKGSPEFSWIYDGVEYHFTSREELEWFKAHPDQCAPQVRGCDPLVLTTEGREVPGDIRYGAFYNNELYLLSSYENRQRFRANPERYIQMMQFASQGWSGAASSF